MTNFSPKFRTINILNGQKPDIGSNYAEGIVVSYTISGVRICTNFESGIETKILNCPLCPEKNDCKAYNINREISS